MALYEKLTMDEMRAVLNKFDNYCNPPQHCPMLMTHGKYHCKAYRQFEETCKALNLNPLMDKRNGTAEEEFLLSCDRLQCDLVEYFLWEHKQDEAEIQKALEPPQDADGQMKFDF